MAYWHTGHEILKKTASTGPRESASCIENFDPSIVGNSNFGALVPAVSATMFFFPPKRLVSHFMASLFLGIYWMICALRRIFLASPVRGRVCKLEVLIQTPRGFPLSPLTTCTVKSVTVIACFTEN